MEKIVKSNRRPIAIKVLDKTKDLAISTLRFGIRSMVKIVVIGWRIAFPPKPESRIFQDYGNESMRYGAYEKNGELQPEFFIPRQKTFIKRMIRPIGKDSTFTEFGDEISIGYIINKKTGEAIPVVYRLITKGLVLTADGGVCKLDDIRQLCGMPGCDYTTSTARCERCHIPLCKLHATFVEKTSYQKVAYCPKCFKAFERNQRNALKELQWNQSKWIGFENTFLGLLSRRERDENK